MPNATCDKKRKDGKVEEDKEREGDRTKYLNLLIFRLRAA